MHKINANLPTEVINKDSEEEEEEDEEHEEEEEDEEVVAVVEKCDDLTNKSINTNTTLTTTTTTTNNNNLKTTNDLSLNESLNTNKQQQQQQQTVTNNDILNLKEILQLFNCAISQEQAWAVLYQILVEFKQLLENSLDMIKQNLDQIDIYLLNFAKDGSIILRFKNTNNNLNLKSTSSSSTSTSTSSSSSSSFTNHHHHDIEQEKSIVEPKVLKAIAYLIFDALDYGNNYLNEPVLQSSLSHLLLLISGHYKEYNNSSNRGVSEDDEGYEQEEEETISLEKAIEVCLNNVAEADYHYKAVCRGLYAQAYELKAFLAKIEDSKKTIQKSGEDPTHYCFEVLDKTDWAKLWMQVIHELRNGVKLRKVCELTEIRRHIEYELTPFEILLDQIRARRYHLKKVSLDASYAPKLKKDARDIILDFIRSRPPLRKCSQRSLDSSKVILKAQQQPINLHEQLMNSIRNYSTPLRKIQINELNNSSKNSTNSDDQNTSKETAKVKRLLKADKKLLNNLTSSDDDDSDIDYEELKNLPILPEEEEFIDNPSIYLSKNSNYDQFNEILMDLSSKYSKNNKKRIKAPDSLKSPLAPWREPVENWKALVTEDVLPDHLIMNNSNVAPNRRHTMNLADLHSISTSLSSLNIFSGKKSTNKLSNNSTDSENVQTKKITNANDKSGGECLKLTFEELCHIRNVLTKAELDYLLFDNQIYHDVSKGKVCFSCRKTKFHIFNWASKCRICQQRVCKKCLRSAQLKNGQIAQVPLFKLCPNKVAIKSKHDSITDNDNEDYEIISCTIEDSIDYSKSNSNNNSRCDDSNQSNSESNNFSNQLFDICVDCYQIMDGVVVSANEIDLGIQNQQQQQFIQQQQQQQQQQQLINKNSPLNGRKKSNNKDLIKSVHLANKKINKNDLSPSLSSPSSIGMDYLKDMNVNNKAESSPISNKILLSHHSTPTLSNTNTPAVGINTSLEKNTDLSTIIVQSTTTDQFGEFDSFNQNNSVENNSINNKNLRQSLTLDLQPVYSK